MYWVVVAYSVCVKRIIVEKRFEESSMDKVGSEEELNYGYEYHGATLMLDLTARKLGEISYEKETEDKIKEGTLKVDQGTDAIIVVIVRTGRCMQEVEDQLEACETLNVRKELLIQSMSSKMLQTEGLVTKLKTQLAAKGGRLQSMPTQLTPPASMSSKMLQTEGLVTKLKTQLAAKGGRLQSMPTQLTPPALLISADEEAENYVVDVIRMIASIRKEMQKVDAAFIPDVGSNGCTIVLDAVGGFVTWPKNQVVLDPKAIVFLHGYTPSTIQMITARNPVKEILVKLNLPDHRSILMDSKVTQTKHGRMTKPYSSPRFTANCFNAGYLKMEVKLKNLKKDAILKLFKITYQERYEHVGPEVTSSQDGKVYKMANQDYDWLMISSDLINIEDSSVLLLKLNEVESMSNMDVICKNGGFMDLSIHHVGVLWIWIQFSLSSTCSKFQENSTMKNLYSSIKTPSPSYKVDEGMIWIEISGDPLSPFLFILAMEGLHGAMSNTVNSGLIRVIKLGSSNISLSHLFYADDVTPFKIFLGGSQDAKSNTWVKWSNVLPSFGKGCLNIGSLKAFNLSLFQKWRWRLFSSLNAHWVKVIKALHGQEGGLDYQGCSFNDTWSRIVGSSNFLHSKDIIPHNSFHFKADIGIRNMAYLRELLLEISQVDLNSEEDTCIWSMAYDGVFSIKSIYCVISFKLLLSMLSATTWEKTLPRRVNIFLWRMSLDRLPHRLNLSTRGIDIPTIWCPSCNGNVESAGHILFECDLVKEIWSLVRKWCDTPFPPFASYDVWKN
ncbi:RNA-directed DNA polymerase, eukaryota, reverse transcriptase zinc-binding domain protein [Tanacetum coccineum]